MNTHDLGVILDRLSNEDTCKIHEKQIFLSYEKQLYLAKQITIIKFLQTTYSLRMLWEH